MIISHKYKFIFIKTKKTAGTSIEVFLSQHCGADDIITPIKPPVEPHMPRNYKDEQDGFIFGSHIPACKVQARVSPEIWDRYFKFCVERNPWDKTISHYYMLNSNPDYGPFASFDDYLQRKRYCRNVKYYTDAERRQVIVDRVLKYEHLNTHLSEVFEQLGIPFDGALDVRAKSRTRLDRRHYRDFYNDEQRHIVEKIFAKEIRIHGYTF